ncbi:MAG TPA: FecR family protein [Bacteroidota bacterium]|nr:FecR family protein [Bacteroidota bacterium]
MRRSYIVMFCIMLAAPASASEKNPVAAVHKPFGTVDCNADGIWKKAAPAMPLFSGNVIRTHERSFAIIKFLESSILRVQERSEVEIRGTKSSGKEFSKNVHMRSGGLGFNVKKRPNEKFEFTTPTSVASIRGTEGALFSDPDSSDLLVLETGSVLFTNTVSHRSVDVLGGQTGQSFANGEIRVRPSLPGDIDRMHHLRDLGSMSDTTGTLRGDAGQQRDELRIRMKDQNGNPKTLILKFE